MLANLYLDQADKELERRGLRFTRFANDMLIYVRSEAAANRVMKSFSRFPEDKLKLIVNTSKSKVARPDEIKYLDFGFKRNGNCRWKATVHEKSIDRLQEKIMELTKRNWSISLDVRIEKLNQLIRGWCNLFQMCRDVQILSAENRPENQKKNPGNHMGTMEKDKEKGGGLIKLGCPRDKAHSYACARQGYTRCASTFLNRYIKNIHLKRKGILPLEEYFSAVSYRVHVLIERTALRRTAPRVEREGLRCHLLDCLSMKHRLLYLKEIFIPELTGIVYLLTMGIHI